LEARYDRVDWAAMAEADVVLTLPAWAGQPQAAIRRIDLLVDLLEQQGATVRTDLIRLHLVDRALAEAGMVPDARILAAEWARWDERARRGYGQEELYADPAFRRAACLHEYVLRLVEPDEAALKAWYAERVAQFTVQEAVDLSLIRLAKRTLQLNGQAIPDVNAQQLQLRLLGQAREQIAASKEDFAAAWARIGRASDPYAPGGRVGWVTRDGKPERTGPRPVPPALLAAAVAVVGGETLPHLMPLYDDDEWLAVVRVEAFRPAVASDYARQHDEIRRAWVEARLAQAVEGVVNDLLREAQLVFGDLGEHIDRRKADQVRLLKMQEH
jgi:hypothetical protein